MSFANWDEIIETCRYGLADPEPRSRTVLQEKQLPSHTLTVQQIHPPEATEEDRMDTIFDTMLARQYGV
ncbi:hypothetical protein DFP93_102436 [Aneurinibacillus soli]|uniref:Uncharacterized protein n=1 Tax=Aneurinibacillus soli TaxID=1500254 RepID=A0A0U4WF28_9BACL|nr:hypothetical protein [Aneurinibacillus soli]PYE63746.1 hypothetical protein DFP93_102436 [Aneurinibacillus soli]BAU27321.1 hypothetical protein CB4_01495 [Aneurinibacillus soli]